MSDKKLEWEPIPKMGSPRVFVSIIWVNDLLYVIGGCNEVGEPVDTIQSYDPNTGVWSDIKSMPTKRAAPIVAVFSGYLLVIGGVGISQKPVDAVEMLSPNKDRWKQLTSLSEPLMGMAHVVQENKILLFGGMGADTNPRDQVKSFIINPNKGNEKWLALPSMPTARFAAHALQRDNKIYVIGGRQGKLPVSAFEVFDLNTKSWTIYPNIPTKRVFCNYVMTDNYIVTLGGLKQTAQQGFSDACELYPIIKNEKGHWLSDKKYSMPTKRGDFSSIVVNNKVLVMGGIGNSGGALSSVELFNPENKKWSRLNDTLVQRCTGGSTLHDGCIYLIGGVSSAGPTDHCEMCKVPHEQK